MRKFAALLAIASGVLAAPIAQAVPISYVAQMDQNEPVPTTGHWNIMDIYSPRRKVHHVSTGD